MATFYVVVAGDCASEPGVRGVADTLEQAKHEANLVVEHERDNFDDVHIEKWETSDKGSSRSADLWPTIIKSDITIDWNA